MVSGQKDRKEGDNFFYDETLWGLKNVNTFVPSLRNQDIYDLYVR